MISSISFDQHEIIKNIVDLHCPNGIELDPTYSKGMFYKDSGINEPLKKFDICPQTDDTYQSNANNLPFPNETIETIMFDPPFVVGRSKTSIIANRFGIFKSIKECWTMYTECLEEFYRILKIDGTLIFKCQDTVDSGKQYFSHLYIMNEAERMGFYNKDLFVLLAKSRIERSNYVKQHHARKFHSYFIIIKKLNPKHKQMEHNINFINR